MRHFVLLLVVLCGCVPPAAELCRRGVQLECERQFECAPEATKNSEGFKGGYGSSVDECLSKLATQARCSEKVSDDELCTGADSGKSFDLSQASACSNERRALSCADFLDPAKTPASCSQRCQ